MSQPPQATAARQLAVEVVAEPVCPYCYLGWARLKRAIAERPDIKVAVTWSPFQLDPSIPPEGHDRAAYLISKVGSSSELDRIHAQLTAMGDAEGVRFRFREMKRLPNTANIHRLILMTRARGFGTEIIDAVFKAHFSDLRDLTSLAVLADIAASIGMNRDEVYTSLESDAGRQTIVAARDRAMARSIRSVPFFDFGGVTSLPGAGSTEAMRSSIDVASKSLLATD